MIRPSVLVFAGADPSGGAGIQADIQAISALGAHPLTVITALTVQDNDRVFGVHPVPAAMLRQQAQALIDKMDIAAVKIGIVGNRVNADAIAELLQQMKQRRPKLPVVLDPVLAAGHGDVLSQDNPVQSVSELLPLATIVMPNLPEAAALCDGDRRLDTQVENLLRHCPNVMIKGGHCDGAEIINRWFSADNGGTWKWPRLEGEFHGSGCTLASALAALLARGMPMAQALERAQAYCHQALSSAYAIADGQRIPNRIASTENIV